MKYVYVLIGVIACVALFITFLQSQNPLIAFFGIIVLVSLVIRIGHLFKNK